MFFGSCKLMWLQNVVKYQEFLHWHLEICLKTAWTLQIDYMDCLYSYTRHCLCDSAKTKHVKCLLWRYIKNTHAFYIRFCFCFTYISLSVLPRCCVYLTNSMKMNVNLETAHFRSFPLWSLVSFFRFPRKIFHLQRDRQNYYHFFFLLKSSSKWCTLL